jgi:hypothetical protein
MTPEDVRERAAKVCEEVPTHYYRGVEAIDKSASRMRRECAAAIRALPVDAASGAEGARERVIEAAKAWANDEHPSGSKASVQLADDLQRAVDAWQAAEARAARGEG